MLNRDRLSLYKTHENVNNPFGRTIDGEAITSFEGVVLAASPVLSAKWLAARPVGARNATATAFALRILRIELTSVVLPTPGLPVRTTNLLASVV